MTQLSQAVAELTETIEQISENAKFLLCGHPILMIEHQDDIDQFDLGTGKGFDCWEGWAICDGQSHYNSKLKKNIQTPNLIDRFVVSAGGSYSVGDTGGSNTVVLSVNELPAHNHAVTDPGHTHDITDPGHNHAVTDPGHTHAITVDPHEHVIDGAGDHQHTYEKWDLAGADYDGGGVAWNASPASANTSAAGAHTHTMGQANVTANIQNAFTGVSVDNAFIGITETESANTGITTNNTGADAAHENRPPYYALMFIMKI